MAISDTINKTLPKKSDTCERCGADFACEIAQTECWCTQVTVSEEAREYMRSKFESCLCRGCLEAIEAELTKK